MKKRSQRLHKNQQLSDIWNSDTLPNYQVNTNLIKNASLKDLYEDCGDNYENLEQGKPIPFHLLHEEEQQKFYKKLDELENVIKSSRILPKNSTNLPKSDQEINVCVPKSHRHDIIKLPKSIDFHLIFEDKENAMKNLNEKEMMTLFRISKYNEIENFLAPKFFKGYQSNIGSFLDELFQEKRLECTTLEIIKEFNAIFIIIKLDDRDLFYVSIVFTILYQNLNINFDDHNIIYWELQDEKEKNTKMKDLKIELQTHFYFTCGCTKSH